MSSKTKIGASSAMEISNGVRPSLKKKKTKTFTGCATCRLRKIKCDLGKPFCERCKRSGLVCAGYTIQLCWFRPIQFDKYGYQIRFGDDDEENVQKGFQRRNVEFVKYEREYQTYEEMDRDLGMLHSPNYALIEDQQTWFQGPFGVFEGLKNIPNDLMNKRKKIKRGKYAKQRMEIVQVNLNERRQKSTPSDTRNTSNHSTPMSYDSFANGNAANGTIDQGHKNDDNLFSNDRFNHEWLSNELRFDALLSATAVSASIDQNKLFTDLLYPIPSNVNGSSGHENPGVINGLALPYDETDGGLQFSAYEREVFNVLRPQAHMAEQEETRANSDTTIRTPDEIIIETAESKMPEDAIKIIETPVLTPELRASLNIPTNGIQVTSLTRFLLDYYFNHVADLMTVVMFPRNPWKTIYFPRAVLALGDLAARGKSSKSRMSLLNALLAVVCFNLQSKYEKGSTEMKFFLDLGIQFRTQATAFLKKMLQSGINASKMQDERYKDVIVAMLSMNTIDVVWGTMADCQYHLSLCGEFIAQRMAIRPQLSNKAKSLHRIYSFLRLIQDSTSFQNLENINEEQKNKYLDMLEHSNANRTCKGEFQEVIYPDDGTIGIVFVKSDTAVTRYEPNFINCNISTTEKGTKLLLTEAMYGITNSLILFFSEAVKLLKLKLYLEKNGDPKDNLRFKNVCTTFEKRLIEWQPEWILKDDEGNFFTDFHEGLHHQIHSMHNALIVYYFTLIRELGDIFLQKHCTDCISHLESLLELSKDKNVKIHSMFFQGFIAGCSATDTRLQSRFREWAVKFVKLSGIGSYWGARQIMFEVWRRRKNAEPNDNWLSVHRDWEMNVMLS